MSDGLLNNIDEIIHVKARLGIMSILVAKGKSDFSYLKSKLGLTDGNREFPDIRILRMQSI